jgi:hypothetical protein
MQPYVFSFVLTKLKSALHLHNGQAAKDDLAHHRLHDDWHHHSGRPQVIWKLIHKFCVSTIQYAKHFSISHIFSKPRNSMLGPDHYSVQIERHTTTQNCHNQQAIDQMEKGTLNRIGEDISL